MWTVIPNHELPATKSLPLWRRALWRLRYWHAAPVARVSFVDDRAGTITTHPDNVAAICAFLTSRGQPHRVGAPALRTVAGGKS